MPHKQTPPLYWIWTSMRGRCRDKNYKQWKDYGGRGIKVCERWSSYECFIADMGPRPSSKHSLDRIHNDGDYEPGNCRWATRKEQQRNQRRTVKLTIEGKEYLAIELAEQTGMKADTIIARANAGLTLAEVKSPIRRVFRGAGPIAGAANGARLRALTRCKRGHEFTPENTRITPEGWRNCKTCHREKMRRRNAAKRAAHT